MGTFFLIVIILCILFWPWISRWLRGYIARRGEDMIRKMMGMPSRKEEEKIRKEYEKKSGHANTSSKSSYRNDDNLSRGEKIVRDMQEYAEDVDYIEIKDNDPNGI